MVKAANITYSKRRVSKKKDTRDRLHVELMKLPAEIDQYACFKAYRMLDNRKCKMHLLPNPKIKCCRQNPYCIHRLGNEKWERLRRDQLETPSPVLTRRDQKTQPCGLSNHGNFCYVNSFIQIWYNDLPFRQAIYDWRPLPDWKPPEGAKLDIQQVMNVLQELFVTMHITPYEHTDALEFICLLKLDNEQHDVQEFTILFFDALDRYLSQHPNGEATRLAIRQRFEGTSKQILSCTCGHESVTETVFLSLTLHVNGFNSLVKALDDYFQPEELSDYKCSECGKSGGVTRRNECSKLPPVLMLQLNRYSFDASGQNKKITTAIQYPREIDLESLHYSGAVTDNVAYNLCAVMIHEGTSSHCGHYYDLIKDPSNDQWFSYNDKEVTQSKTPGVQTEKQNIGRSTSDMRGCYALIYRCADEAALSGVENDAGKEGSSQPNIVVMPPSEVVDKIEKSLNENFQKESRDGNRSYAVWRACVDEKQEFLERLWVENGNVIQNDPSSVVFLPTALLQEIHEKEFQVVEKMRDLDDFLNDQNDIRNGFDRSHNDDADYVFEAAKRLEGLDSNIDDEDYDERLQETIDEIRSEKLERKRKLHSQAANPNAASEMESLRLIYTVDALSEIRMCLCAHGKISLEALNKGEIKAVNREPAEDLLRAYTIGIRRSPNGEGIADEPVGLLSGTDLCVDCIHHLRSDFSFKQKLESRCEVVDKMLKRNREYNPPESPGENQFCWGSRKQLTSYRKLVAQELNYHQSLALQARSEIVFSQQHPGFKNLTNPSKSSPQQSPASHNGHPSPKRQRLSVPDQSTSARQTSCEILEEPEPSEFPFSNDQSDSEEPKASTSADSSWRNGNNKAQLCEEVAEGASNGDAKNDNEDETIHSDSENEVKEEFSPEESKVLEDDPEIEIIKEVANTNLKPVVFNEDLFCMHGGLSVEAKRVWMSKEEWDEVVQPVFVNNHYIPVDTEPCVSCKQHFDTNEQLRGHTQGQLTELNLRMGKLLKGIERRRLNDETATSEPLTKALCAKFVSKFRHSQKSRVLQIPDICQECLMCAAHGLPFQSVLSYQNQRDQQKIHETAAELAGLLIPPPSFPPAAVVSSDPLLGGPLLLTDGEWNAILAHMKQVLGSDFQPPKKIEVEDGQFKEFCVECHTKLKQIIHEKRCIYPNGAEIFVKLKEDEDGQAKQVAVRGPTTRRVALKNIIRVKMRSTDTVKQLKVKLYEKTSQSPADQLICMGENALEDRQTLQEAGVEGNNSDSPLILITQQRTEIVEAPRQLEKGFKDTALA